MSTTITVLKNGREGVAHLHQVTTTQHQHPEYIAFIDEWDKISDCLAGEEVVKALGRTYLPDISVGKNSNEVKYQDYVKRANFIPYADRTVQGFVGTVFRRSVQVTLPKASSFDIDNMSKDKFQVMARKIGTRIFEKGRAGVYTNYLTKKKRTDNTVYRAEDILSWDEDEDGELIYVLLRDIKRVVGRPTRSGDNTNKLMYAYKALELINGVYRVTYFDHAMNQTKVVTPKNKGRMIKFIPFTFFGSEDNSATVDRSPINAIVDANFAHYRTSALLETGRRFTAFPIYTVPVSNRSEETEAYEITPSVVWETPLDSKPAILEYFGQGLNHLAEALDEKERNIIQLGARSVGIRDISSRYEASSIFQLLYQAELALLINITDLLSAGLQQVIFYNMVLADTVAPKTKNEITVEVSKEFKAANLAGGDIRAIALLAEKHLLPLEEVFNVLKSAEYISNELTFTEFKLLIDAEKQDSVDMKGEETLAEEIAKVEAPVKADVPKPVITPPQAPSGLVVTPPAADPNGPQPKI